MNTINFEDQIKSGERIMIFNEKFGYMELLKISKTRARIEIIRYHPPKVLAKEYDIKDLLLFKIKKEIKELRRIVEEINQLQNQESFLMNSTADIFSTSELRKGDEKNE